MSAPLLMKQECPQCDYAKECEEIGIPQDTLKGLIYLMSVEDGQRLARTIAERKLRRKGIDKGRFLSFVDRVKKTCPFYNYV